MATKLTKKQKKALAFRDRRGKGKATDHDEDIIAVPISEDQDTADLMGHQMEITEGVRDEVEEKQSKPRAKKCELEKDGSARPKKRKRVTQGEGVERTKRMRKAVGEEGKAGRDQDKLSANQRLLLFVGTV